MRCGTVDNPTEMEGKHERPEFGPDEGEGTEFGFV